MLFYLNTFLQTFWNLNQILCAGKCLMFSGLIYTNVENEDISDISTAAKNFAPEQLCQTFFRVLNI